MYLFIPKKVYFIKMIICYQYSSLKNCSCLRFLICISQSEVRTEETFRSDVRNRQSLRRKPNVRRKTSSKRYEGSYKKYYLSDKTYVCMIYSMARFIIYILSFSLIFSFFRFQWKAIKLLYLYYQHYFMRIKFVFIVSLNSFVLILMEAYYLICLNFSKNDMPIKFSQV